MKKMGIACVMVVCLATSVFSSRVITSLGVYLDMREQKTERLREELKDPAKLRECLGDIINSYTSIEEAMEFKRKFSVDDESMQRVLMDIIRECSAKNKWELPQQRKPEEPVIASLQLREALRCMGACANADGKRFLLDITTDNAKDNFFRIEAVHSYMNRANTQEKWDAIARFLADDVRSGILPFFNMYHAAVQAYDEAEGDTQKREAIVVAVSAALAKEADKNAFAEADKRLAERSTEYAESPQRKAALERMSKPPEKETP